MTKITPDIVLGWDHDVADVGAQGFTAERTASDEERTKIAQKLDLKSCGKLTARYRIKPIAGGGYRLTGELSADVVQACVVTLEAVPAHLDAPFNVEYWPDGGQEADGASEELSALGAAEIERLEDGRIDAGRIVFEQLAASLDPYPRIAGAELGEVAAGGSPGRRDNPFAVLEKLKRET